jgi:hypothetical protein
MRASIGRAGDGYSPEKSVERSILLMAARACLDGETPREASGLLAGPVDWDWIVRRAEAERLGAVLYAVVSRLSIPAGIRDHFGVARASGRRQYLLGAQQITKVLSEFERDGVPMIPLRGPALAELLYRDPSLRPFTDLDLLVREADLPRALHLLARLGYRHLEGGRSLSHELAWRHAASFMPGRPDELPIDLHWGLVDYPGIAPTTAVHHQELWDRAVRVETSGGACLGLCPEDLLIYLALHWAIHHALAGLGWELDLALLIRRGGDAWNWEVLAERARRWQIRRAIFYALREVRERFEVAIPPWFLARLRPAGPRCILLDWLRHRGEECMERLDYLIPLLVMDRACDILRALSGAVLPPASWLRCRYGKPSAFSAYLTHWARIGSACARTARASLGRAHR